MGKNHINPSKINKNCQVELSNVANKESLMDKRDTLLLPSDNKQLCACVGIFKHTIVVNTPASGLFRFLVFSNDSFDGFYFAVNIPVSGKFRLCTIL